MAAGVPNDEPQLPGFDDARGEAAPERDVLAEADALLAGAETAEQAAEAALAGLRDSLDPDPSPRPVRTPDERRQAVHNAVVAATPERDVRTPAERREAVRRVLEGREEERRRRRARERERTESSPAASAAASPALPRARRADPDARRPLPAASGPRRPPRSAAQRLADARAAMEEMLRRRDAEKRALALRMEARRSAQAHGGETAQPVR